MTSDGLWLHTESLFSKWGFSDGDVPDEVFDFVFDNELDDGCAWWRPLLAELVKTWLLPSLSKPVDVYVITTIHNPVRAASVAGVPVPDDVIYGAGETDYGLTPAAVCVPWDAVFRFVAEEIARHDPAAV